MSANSGSNIKEANENYLKFVAFYWNKRKLMWVFKNCEFFLAKKEIKI